MAKRKMYFNIDEVERDLLPKYHLYKVIQKSVTDPQYSEELADILFDKKSV
jgi:hypothetical protein